MGAEPRDGSVEVYAIGETDQVERFIAQLRVGSPAAQVETVQVEPAAAEQLSGFVRRATVYAGNGSASVALEPL